MIDAFSRRITGWRAATTMTTTLVLDALEHAVWTRPRGGVADLAGLVHHHDAGRQYTSITFTERAVVTCPEIRCPGASGLADRLPVVTAGPGPGGRLRNVSAAGVCQRWQARPADSARFR